MLPLVPCIGELYILGTVGSRNFGVAPLIGGTWSRVTRLGGRGLWAAAAAAAAMASVVGSGGVLVTAAMRSPASSTLARDWIRRQVTRALQVVTSCRRAECELDEQCTTAGFGEARGGEDRVVGTRLDLAPGALGKQSPIPGAFDAIVVMIKSDMPCTSRCTKTTTVRKLLYQHIWAFAFLHGVQLAYSLHVPR